MTGLGSAILGAWELLTFSSTEVDTGAVRHPLGTAPRGLIMYTPDGYMSAQLADADLGGYISYGGPFHVDEETSTLHHDVSISSMPELLTQPQFRHAEVDHDLLTLSANATDDGGAVIHSVLVWKRVTAESRNQSES